MEIPIPCRKRRRRLIFNYLPDSGTYLRIYPSHLGYCDRTAYTEECHRSLYPDASQMEVPGNPYIPCTSAYYDLLMTEARDKNYIIQTNDSLIQSALTYYNGTNDIEKRARAHYYSGCVYRDSQRRTESMTQYLIAKPLAEKAGERGILSLIYLNLGYLYY